ncbi:flagellar protein FlgN [Paenibacillus pasadenensis]|uniref:flagellar protein FlgN n=1 Tax=Paenibacillus pasadenensis TaxID=217090 RepID=UPI00203C7057|nr:flagellar protein FlgN [Paenibacillus pasadenensis]MCM3750190.1 flagellar protein FlgN [Paenibacillus pasadenensis]
MTIQELIDTLEQQSGLYRELLELAAAKTPVLVKGDVNALSALLMKERKLAKQIEELEVRRQTLVNIHFSRLQLRLRSGKLSDLIRTVNQPEEKQRLAELQKELTQLLEDVRSRNEHNLALTKQSLEFIEFSLELTSEAPYDDYTYTHPQLSPAGHAKAGMFDRKG